MTDASPRTSLNAWLAERAGDPSIRLFAETTAAMRADADFIARDEDLAGAAFLEDEARAALADDSLEQAFARIDEAQALDAAAEAWRRRAGPLAGEIAALPSPVREAAIEAMRHHRWKLAGLGIQRLNLAGDAVTRAVLMRIEPGRGIASHDHEGEELTLVLTGAYHDGFSHYGAGDVSLAMPGFAHRPKADLGEVCYVLLAYRGAPKFDGLFGLAQRTVGFPTPLTKP
jgi:putative transcriptional regulator